MLTQRCIAVRLGLTTLLLVQQTAFDEQELPERTPTTLIGEHCRPMRPVRSPRTMPRRPESKLVVEEVDCSTWEIEVEWMYYTPSRPDLPPSRCCSTGWDQWSTTGACRARREWRPQESGGREQRRRRRGRTLSMKRLVEYWSASAEVRVLNWAVLLRTSCRCACSLYV